MCSTEGRGGVWGERRPQSLVYERSSGGHVRAVDKPITGASYRRLYCFEPQTAVGVPPVPFFSPDTRGLGLPKGGGKSLDTGPKRSQGIHGAGFL